MLKCFIFALAIVGAFGQYESAPRSVSPQQFNPCTEETLRAPEIQLFANPNDQSSYLICTDVNTPISMPCSPGTVFDQNLRHCIPIGWEAPRCPVGTCFNNADCVIDELNQASCICRVGFTGARCETNIDECALEGNQVCGQAGGNCVDQVNAYYCEWNQGQEIGLSAENKINRPCSLTDLEAGKQFFELVSPNANVFLQCTGEWSFLVTKCADMLFWHQELRTCSIERPLAKTGVCRNYPCRNDGTCVDLGGSSFRCECKDGYMGDLCEEPIDFCLNRPCQNGGRCVSHPGGFNCVCQDNIVDQSCATGVQNPCGGSSEYLPNNVDFTKYISCSLGFGFVKSCAPGLKWNQETLTCILIEEVKAPVHQKVSTYGSYSSYASETTTTTLPPPPPKMVTPSYQQRPPMTPPETPSYSQNVVPTPQPPMTPPQTPSYSQNVVPTPQPPMTPPQTPSYSQNVVPNPQPPMTPPQTPSYSQHVVPTPQPPMTPPQTPSYSQHVVPTPQPPMTPPQTPSYSQHVVPAPQRPMTPPQTPSYSQHVVPAPQRPMTPPQTPSYSQHVVPAPQLPITPSHQQRPQVPKATPSTFGSNYGSRMLSFFRQ